MGASPGMVGTARAQCHLREVFVNLDLHTFNKPEAVIGVAGQRCDAEGDLTDEKSMQVVAKLVEALVALTRKLK